jgi:aerobic-type carbon monoxide dehydrogenase small subunit (CoxS/CutS family)
MPKSDPYAELTVEFQLDGQDIRHTARSGRSALDFLRQECGQKQLLPGCSPQGLCGCCAILVNGKARLSCTLKVKNLKNKCIETSAGLNKEEQLKLQMAFAEAGATQCGYCTAGIILQTAKLLRDKPTPSDADIDKALNMHLCRCTGYTKIRDAIHSLNKKPSSSKGIVSPQGFLASLGNRPRVADIQQQSMLYAVPIFVTHASGTLESLTFNSPKGNSRFLTTQDLLLTTGLPLSGCLSVGEKANSSSDIVAVTLSSSLDEARLASDNVQIKMKANEVRLTQDSNGRTLQHAEKNTGLDSIQGHKKISCVIETPMQEPAYLEPDSVVCIPYESSFLLIAAGVNPHQLKETLLHLIPEGFSLRIDSWACGASYGARSVTVIAGLALRLAIQTSRPISLPLTMEQSQRIHPKFPPQRASLKLETDENGAPYSLEATIDILGGSHPPEDFAEKILHSIAIPYEFQHSKIEIRVLESNHPQVGLLRGRGLLGFTIALERLMDSAAHNNAMDPLSYRYLHLAHPEGKAIIKNMAEAYVRHNNSTIGVAIAALKPQPNGKLTIALRYVLGQGIEIHTPFPESGQGLEIRLAILASRQTGFSSDIFSLISSTQVPLAKAPNEMDLLPLARKALCDACQSMMRDYNNTKPENLNGRLWFGHAQTEHSEIGMTGSLCISKDNMIQEIITFGVHRLGNNKTLEEGQLEGASHMGLGAALHEQLVFNKKGIPHPQLRSLKLLKMKKSPLLSSKLIDCEIHSMPDAAYNSTAAAVISSFPSKEDKIGLPLDKLPKGQVTTQQ